MPYVLLFLLFVLLAAFFLLRGIHSRVSPEGGALLLFVAVLLGCVITGLSILYALAAGYLIFCSYGLRRGHSISALLKMSLQGVRTVKNILILFVLIGVLTALWRAAGTIPAIVCAAAGLIRPSVVVVMSFLLNCLISVLTGTAFGTAATMGVICMSISTAMGVPAVLTGGAILSGVFFGDRCSPVSTSALLVAELTATDIFSNLRRMMRTALLPFVLACAIYAALGAWAAPAAPATGAAGSAMQALFAANFKLGWVTLLPALLILVLSLFRVAVRRTMLASIAAAFCVCLWYQGIGPAALGNMMLLGYRVGDPALSAMIDGGGIVSMFRVMAIVCLSSSYAGLFAGTGLLDGLKDRVEVLRQKTGDYGCMLLVSIAVAMISCNQTLAIMLTEQICTSPESDAQTRAIDLENTAVVVSPLVPWSIAGAVPLASVGAPTSAILAACYLYLLPLWQLWQRRRRKPRG